MKRPIVLFLLLALPLCAATLIHIPFGVEHASYEGAWVSNSTYSAWSNWWCWQATETNFDTMTKWTEGQLDGTNYTNFAAALSSAIMFWTNSPPANTNLTNWIVFRCNGTNYTIPAATWP
jgi:hypothetical protein